MARPQVLTMPDRMGDIRSMSSGQQQASGLGFQSLDTGLPGAPVKLEQLPVIQHIQSMGSVKQGGSSILQYVKQEQLDNLCRQHSLAMPIKVESGQFEQESAHEHEQQLGLRLQRQQGDALPTFSKMDQQQGSPHLQPLHSFGPSGSEQKLPFQSLHMTLPLEQPAAVHQQPQQLQAHMNFLQQQRLLHQHRTQLQQQQQQLFQQTGAVGLPKQPVYEPGMCARRLMQYIHHQRQRPQDNNIHFWRKFIGEFFAPRAKKRWCVSQYGNNGRQPMGVFPQDVWHCQICGSRPGRGFETTVEVLPRLCKIKYDSGILEELLYVDVPNEYPLNSGLLVLEYGKAIQESIFDHLRVVRDGQLRIKFSPDLKILNWEFCARSHEELLPRRLLVLQVAQLAAVAQKYQNSVNQSQSGVSALSMQDLQTNCQFFVRVARQLARTLEAPTVNDLGYTKRYVRCLQISEVVNSMKDLIDFSWEHRMGPIDSLKNFPRQTTNVGSTSCQDLRILGETSKGSLISNGSTHLLKQSMNALQHHALCSLQNTLPDKAPGSFSTGVNCVSGALASKSSLSLQGMPMHVNFLQNCNTSSMVSPNMVGQMRAPQCNSGSAVNLLQRSLSQGKEQNAVQQLLQDKKLPKVVEGDQSCGEGSQMRSMNGLNIPLNGTGIAADGSNVVVGNDFYNVTGTCGRMSSFNDDVLMNRHSRSENGSNVKSADPNLSMSNMDIINVDDGLVMAQDQNTSLDDPSQNLLNEFVEGDDILSEFGNSSLAGLPFNWKLD